MPVHNTRELPLRPIRPGWSGRFVHTDNFTLAYYDLDAGASISEHSHPEEEVWNLIAGEIEITIEGESHTLVDGAVAIVPPGAAHSVTVVADAHVIIVDHPVRHAVGGVDTR